MGETEELKKKWNMSEEDINNIKKNIKSITLRRISNT